ncbi:hypothetical protein H17ap60334_07433 [Thermosipho africanus H17ap60334]|uniref:HEPN domain-containing protein n=1 Tax=Thermosipho africanus TaxID=2421 RepID=UPI00028EBC8A|nr:HEPN domain-containing protein [Thermosipho africanus]EKF49131.1 hypothetical protein H17ap60334_07433 [Thermosipho africanus H17ap60334]MDK2886949.1 hypothetical protein [Thermosipho sp. (in: thermotogales)]
MQFHWDEFLSLAKDLVNFKLQHCSEEAAYRSAISRAYYAAFCYIRDYVIDNLEFNPEKNANVHYLLREHLKKHGKIKVASRLNELRMRRNRCDYDNEVINNISFIANEAVADAEELIKKFKK